MDSWKVVSFFVFAGFFLLFFLTIRFGGKKTTEVGCIIQLVVIIVLTYVGTAIVFAIGNLLDWWAN